MTPFERIYLSNFPDIFVCISEMWVCIQRKQSTKLNLAKKNMWKVESDLHQGGFSLSRKTVESRKNLSKVYVKLRANLLLKKN